jgi:hypothetical protein
VSGKAGELHISDLDAVVGYSDENGNNISLDFSTKQAVILVKIVVDSTKQLAKANSIDLSELHEEAPASEGGAVVTCGAALRCRRRSSRTRPSQLRAASRAGLSRWTTSESPDVQRYADRG